MGFGLYSLVYFIGRLLVTYKDSIKEFDYDACLFTAYIGLFLSVAWLVIAFVFHSDRIFGPYWFGVLLQPLTWLVLTQSLRFKVVRKFLLFRLVISLSFVVTYERLTMWVVTLHRDYLPSGWDSIPDLGLDITVFAVIKGFVIKVALFLLAVRLYHFIMQQLGLQDKGQGGILR